MIALNYYLIAALLFVGGCGTGKHISINDYPGIKPLGYEVSFKISSSSDVAPLTDKLPFEMLDIEKANSIFENILSENKTLFRSSNRPKYTFTIQPLYTLKPGYIRIGGLGANVDYHGFALFRLIVTDAAGKAVHDKYFKVYGMWNTSGTGSIKGPSEMGYYSPTNAITRLGLLDIIAYISQEKFLNDDSRAIINISHVLPDLPFRLKPENVFFTVRSVLGMVKSKPKYNEFGAAVAYFKFIMGEDISSEKQFSPSPWSEGSSEELIMVAKLAYDKNWPFFPKRLDVQNAPYEFE